MQIFNTVCPRNCYSTCSFKVKVDTGKLITIEPQPKNINTTGGPCIKGLSYIERNYAPERILFPLQRQNGNFKQISWEQALDTISRKLHQLKNKFGPHSVLYYASSGMSGLLNGVSTNFWKMYGGATTVYGNLCWPAGLEATRLTLGENKHNVPTDIENAKLILLWGKNPAESNIHQMVPIEKAQRNGAKLVVIDPRRTPSSERADMLIQPKSGTDGLLALTVAKLIIEKEQHDKEFIAKHVKGFDEFKASLANISIEKTSQECGVPLTFIKELAEMIGTIKPMTFVPGYGMQRYSNGGQTTRCLVALSVITGNIGKKGACWHYANLQSYVFDTVKEPDNYYPTEADNPFRRSIPTAIIGESMLGTKNPELKMAWVERGNPVTQNPDSNKVLKAFRKLDFIVVVEQFMTDTALEADIILPAKTMFEQSDIVGSYWNQYVQLRQKVVDPPGEVKPETEIYFLLAKKMGFSDEEISKNFPEPDDTSIERWLQSYVDQFDNLSIEKLKEEPVIAPGLEVIAFEDMKFKTPSGKIELYSDLARSRWGINELPVYVPIEKSSTEFPLYLMSPNTKNRIHSQFGNCATIKALDPHPVASVSPKDAKSRGIRHGDRIRVFNQQGELFTTAKLDYSMRPGNVVIFNGYWNQEGGSPNLLTKGRETDIGHGTAFHDTRVEIERVVK